jgi:hypothetical protein
MTRILQALYRLFMSLWVGGTAIFTFLVTPIIFGSFPRDMAGQLVGKLFPFYFPYLLILVAATLVVFWFGRGPDRSLASRLPLYLLAGALAVQAFVTFKLYPDIVEVKRAVTSFETDSPDAPARQEFRRLHGVSSVLNLLVLADGLALLFLWPPLGRRQSETIEATAKA